jgi:hypothetical protein
VNAFSVQGFHVQRISRHGLWLVSHDSVVELGMLFLRAQEFYESANPSFVGKPFTIHEFVRWYAEHASKRKVFSYFDDFQGYNIPGEAIDTYLSVAIPDINAYDVLFARIVQAIKVLQHGPYYLVGSKTGKPAHSEHEICHGMWALYPEYQRKALNLVLSLPEEERSKIVAILKDEGYSDAVMEDEINAYFSTGLLTSLEDYEHLRPPFMKLFYSYRRKFVDRPRRKRKAVAGSGPFPRPVPVLQANS